MEAFTISLSDVQRCPKRSLSPRHFHPDGRCRCAERPDAEEAVTRAKDDLDAAADRLLAAKDWLAST